MEYFAIIVMTVFAVALTVVVIAVSQETNLYSIRNLFVAVWLYYGFSVGIDLAMGVEIPYVQGEADLMNPNTWGAAAFVMWNYVLCGVAFLLTYTFVGVGTPRAIDHRYDLRLPPDWVFVVVHLVAVAGFARLFLGMSRMERMAMADTSTLYRFACLLVPLVLVADIVVITCTEGKQGKLAFWLALPLALVTGNRTYVVFIALAAAYRWRPSCRGWKLAAIVLMCGLATVTLKTAYGVGHEWWLTGEISLATTYDALQLSLCSLDAQASYLIAVFYTQEPSPWWLGYSYTQLPLELSWPRFLSDGNVLTLGEAYVWQYHEAFARNGGGMAFSAMAEAWLNFGYVGAVLLGVFWGVVAKVFDCLPRGFAFYIVLFMVARMFRSDFASLYKNWVLVWGTLFCVVMGCLLAYTILVDAKRLEHQRTFRKLRGTV